MMAGRTHGQGLVGGPDLTRDPRTLEGHHQNTCGGLSHDGVREEGRRGGETGGICTLCTTSWSVKTENG